VARRRKQFPLRIAPELYAVYEAWASDEFRSVNAQIEAVLADAARRAGRLRRPAVRDGEPHDTAEHPGTDDDAPARSGTTPERDRGGDTPERDRGGDARQRDGDPMERGVDRSSRGAYPSH
jgi:hypothetical protein